MATRAQRSVPDRPKLPDVLDPAPDFTGDVDWYGLVADASLTLPPTVHDLELTECRWQGVDAVGRTFSGLRCRDVVFEGCDLGGAVLDGALPTCPRCASTRPPSTG